MLPEPFPSEAALAFHHAVVATVTYVVTITALLLVLGLMGMLTPTLHLLSVPLLTSGKTEISILVVLQAVLLVLAFLLVSRVVRTYLDYRIYSALGLDPGMATAINAFLSYTLGALGFLFGLRTMGLDLQALTIFAGALGIGAGFGLQTLTSNLAAGLTLVFGRTLRRGDVVTAGDMIGTVQEVGMRVTRLRTLDNIEILVPNAQLVESTLTNYTHTSPFIRLHVPVGVSYGADPHHVREVMLTVARSCPYVEPQPEPEVWFIEFGESSLNFELLVWMNIRQTSRGQVKSALYFALFQAFKAAGIEIPFPQRDLHIRSGVSWQALGKPDDITNDSNEQFLSGNETRRPVDP
ncbi:MAG TPA: mechanosensitive ion channel domain-containing protein, partial [Anaerolineales bacterium]